MEYVGARRTPAAAAAVLSIGSLGLAFAGAVAGSGAVLAASAALLVAAPVALVRVLPWRILVSALVVVIAFIPIKRFIFETGLPFQLEPYRVVIAVLIVGWLACLLVDERLQLRRTGFEGPILLITVAAVGSVLANTSRAASLQPEVLKSLSFLASFFLVFLFVTSVTRVDRDADTVLKTLVSAMAVVGVFAVVESQTGFTPYGRLSDLLPLIDESVEDTLIRGGGSRARGPAEHPIALGAVLVLAVPAAIYLASTAKTKRLWWWSSLGMLSLGVLAALSRTGVVMLAVVGLVYLAYRPRQTARFWPLLLPFMAAAHFAMPGTLGTIRASFFPEGGIVAEQQNEADSCTSSARLADVGPTLSEVAGQPLLGIGHGTRIVDGEKINACILDNQWLATLLETGTLGLVAWVWLLARFIRRVGRGAAARGPQGELRIALVAAVAAYAVGMFTYDALSFVQVTFVLFLLMGLGASLIIRTRLRELGEPAVG